MRLVCVVYFTATEVVLLLKLGGNEVFFRHKSAVEIWVLHNLLCGVFIAPARPLCALFAFVVKKEYGHPVARRAPNIHIFGVDKNSQFSILNSQLIRGHVGITMIVSDF
jgi:hypothetical protein